jgi:DNA (cytosine-5)-methyltransferase 1
MKGKHGNGNGKSLAVEAQRLLPTATAQDSASSSGSNPDWGHGVTLTDAARSLIPTPSAADAGGHHTRSGDRELLLGGLAARDAFGPYSAAIARWEHALGRPAPSPTEPGREGRPRLSPAFVEWMMGLPEGHVTAVPGLSRVAQLKMLGNGVVPQQAALALRLLLDGVAV